MTKEQVREQVWHQVRDQNYDVVRAMVNSLEKRRIGNEVRDWILDEVLRKVCDQVSVQAYAYICGHASDQRNLR